MTTWHYIKQGAIRDEQIGPIDTSTLAKRIERGEIKPETLISSQEKTQGQFVPMRMFEKLALIYEQGREAREEARRAEKDKRAAEKAEAKRERALAKRERTQAKLRPAPQVLPAQAPAQAPAPMPAPMFAAPAAPAPAISQSTTVNVRLGRPFNHLLHFFLTVVTCGAWLPIWILCRLFYRG